MNQTTQLAYRFREVILNGTWIANTNFKAQLENLDLQKANLKFEGRNTIADLAQHIYYYIKGVKNVFAGGKLEIRDKYSFDFPEIKSNDQWHSFLNKFWQDAEDLAQLIEQLPEEQLNQSFVDDKYGTYRRNIDGIIEHSYYHLGQIVWISKFIAEN